MHGGRLCPGFGVLHVTALNLMRHVSFVVLHISVWLLEWLELTAACCALQPVDFRIRETGAD